MRKNKDARVTDQANGFELKITSEATVGGNPGDFQMFFSKDAEGNTVVEVLASITSLTACTLELAFPTAKYSPLMGSFGEWPKGSSLVEQSADLSKLGLVRYNAEVLNTAGTSGTFPILRVVFSDTPMVASENASQDNILANGVFDSTPIEASVSTNVPVLTMNTWPAKPGEQQWLNNYYLPLPELDSQYAVYGNAKQAGYADDIFRMANQARADKKHTILMRDPHLDAVAQAMAVSMAKEGFFDHVNPQGMDVFERIDVTDAPEWWTSGENIAAGYQNPAECHKGWMDSGGHRKNIRNERYRYIGIGAYHAPETEMGWYWVQVFATFESDPNQHDWIEPGERMP